MQQKKSLIFALIGHCIERYDMYLYGCFAPIIGILFFPNEDPMVSIIAGYISFASGYLIRPLGGLFFGYIGDYYGRKKAFHISILLMFPPTFTIGFLPTYAEIGILAPALLLTCRLLQGFSTGGEYTGAIVYILEQAESDKITYSSLIPIWGFIGILVGLAISLLTIYTVSANWFWRVPFIIGALFIIAGYFLRMQSQESPEFINGRHNKLTNFNIVNHFFLDKTYKWKLLSTFFIAVFSHAPLYLSTVYANGLLKAKLNLSHSEILFNNTAIILLWIVCLYLSSITYKRTENIASLCLSPILMLICAFPLFYYVDNVTYVNILIFQSILTIIGSYYLAITPYLLYNLFSVNIRYRSIGGAFTLGKALLGGTTPLIVTLLALQNTIYCAYYLIFISLMGLWAGYYAIYSKSTYISLQEPDKRSISEKAASHKKSFDY